VYRVSRGLRGFTIIELLIVVAVIAILAAIAIPNLLMALQRSKQKRTMANMRNMATAWEARATDLSRYNAAGAAGIEGISQPVTMASLVLALEPTYMKSTPTLDGWNREFIGLTDAPFGDTGTMAQRYAIVSTGRDGSLENAPVMGPTANFDCDIIYSNGTFVEYPEGLQSGR
jgi:type II secretion system protein G